MIACPAFPRQTANGKSSGKTTDGFHCRKTRHLDFHFASACHVVLTTFTHHSISMNTKSCILSLLVFALLCVPGWAVPTVTNIVGTQLAGTKTVQVTYDVAAPGAATVAISLEISSDGGATFSVPATTVTGHIGAGVPVGTGRVLVWNAGVD